MASEAEIIGLIAEGNWGGFFDALDVDKSGSLRHQEFWKWEELGSSDDLIAALNAFDVSLWSFWTLLSMIPKLDFFRKLTKITTTQSAELNSLNIAI